MYLDAVKHFPTAETKLYTEKGTAFHVKTDVFKGLMWYMYSEGSNLVALSPERVSEIKKMNERKEKPVDLVDHSKQEEKVVVKAEPDYTNVVGQDSLNRFENVFKKKKKKKNKPKPGGQSVQAEGNNVAQTTQRPLAQRPAVQASNSTQQQGGPTNQSGNRNKKRKPFRKNPNNENNAAQGN
jgi:hypothetical protein